MGQRVELDHRYAEQVYAGVLGKLIGVYLGRPFEGWSYRDILKKLREVDYYVHDKLGQPLIVTDDDISGTFTFLRALEDYGFTPDLTPEMVGETWLNYLVENRTILWWGGLGNSTEHTAYLRLKSGIKAPQSGSIETNGPIVAEQIGAQIFIDGWGLVNPGDPERAAHYARIAGSVSHDGEAIYGAQVVAALVAQAFVETDIDRMLDSAVAQIPSDSLIYRMIGDLRDWHARDRSWQEGFERIEATYGYDKYVGGCHMVPNHALIIHALLHGQGDFQKSLMVVNTCGWDTDCNSGNVGSILGVRNGLAGLAKPDWRGPVADRMYLPTADGGRAVTDAVQETYRIVEAAQRLRGGVFEAPKAGARFHFSLPGSVQGFCATGASVQNVEGVLRIHLTEGTARVEAETYPGVEARGMGGYGVVASPTLYPGQTIRAKLDGATGKVEAAIIVGVVDAKDETRYVRGETAQFQAGQGNVLEFLVPQTGGYPVVSVGLELVGQPGNDVNLDWMTWIGEPDVEFIPLPGRLWREAWVNGVDDFGSWGNTYRSIHNEGTGLVIQGTREWRNYRVTADVEPMLCERCGIAVRVQGMRRYYALVLARPNTLQIIRALEGDTVLAEVPFAWQLGEKLELTVEVQDSSIRGFVGGKQIIEAVDESLSSGAVAHLVQEGKVVSHRMLVQPIDGR